MIDKKLFSMVFSNENLIFRVNILSVFCQVSVDIIKTQLNKNRNSDLINTEPYPRGGWVFLTNSV